MSELRNFSTSAFTDTLCGRPLHWWLDVKKVLDQRCIKDAPELARVLSLAMPHYRAPDDWSGY